VISLPSTNGFSETLGNLMEAVAAHGLEVFAQIDHAAAARGVGLEMAPEVVILFGNPRAGTPLMQSDPRVGIELPLRLLVWEADGVTSVGYNDPRELGRSYAIQGHSSTLEAMSNLLADIARRALG
jgi:uncharacterized protein (DUF302 family)